MYYFKSKQPLASILVCSTELEWVEKKKKQQQNTYLNLAGERGVGGNIPGSKESK